MSADKEEGAVSTQTLTPLVAEVLAVGVAEGLKRIRALPTYVPEEFRQLLSARLFRAAIEYEKSVSCSPEQSLLTDPAVFATIVQLLSSPDTVEYGLFFLARIKKQNFDERMFADAVGSLHELYLSSTLAYCRNPVLICVLAIEFLERGDSISSATDLPKHRKKSLQWERAAFSIDHKLSRKYGKSIVSLYLDTDIRGRSVSQLVLKLRNDSLVMLEGVGSFLEYGWLGPYRYDIHPMNYSTLYRLLTGKGGLRFDQGRRKVFCFSFKAFVMRSTFRLCLTLGIHLFCIYSLQVDFLSELYRVSEYKKKVEASGATFSLSPNNDFLPYMVYSLSCALYYPLLYYHCIRHRISFNLYNIQFLSAMLVGVGATKCLYLLYSNEYWATEDMSELQDWTSLWLIGLWVNTIAQLEMTEKFGVIVRTLRAMVIKTLGFSVLLWIIIYCYASIYLMRNFTNYPQSESITNALFYFFNAMLGNFDPLEAMSSEDCWAIIIMISFVLVTGVIMLSLLIAMLSSIYDTSQTKVKLEYRKIQMECVSQNIVAADTRLMNCAVAPFSLIAFPLLPLMCTPVAPLVSTIALKAIYIVFILPVPVLFYLITSVLLIIPVYIFQFVLIYRRKRAIVSILDTGVSEEAASKGTVSWALARWAFMGVPLLMKVIVIDTIEYIASLVEDVEPEVLNKEKVTVVGKSTRAEPSSSSELSRLYPKSSHRDSLDFSSDLTSRYLSKFQHLGTDEPLALKLCTFDRQLATPWVCEERMRRRFFRGLEFVDVEAVTAALRKAERTAGTQDKGLIDAVRALIRRSTSDSKEGDEELR